MRAFRFALARMPLLLLAACGGSGGRGPTAPAPIELHSLVAIVFYDEDGDGRLAAAELTRVPDVTVEVAGRTGRSEKVSGRVVIEGVPAGNHAVSIRASTLPPFYAVVGNPVAAQVPQPAGADVLLAVTLPIGENVPNVYMGFGDSITDGEGSSDDRGYLSRLESLLRAHFGPSFLINQGISGTRSNRGAERIFSSLRRVRPAYTLIHYGTNDWNANECKVAFPCFTIDSLRSIVQEVKAARSLPVLATLIPGNPAVPGFVPPERNEWVARMNDLIRPLARGEGAVLADIHAAFLREGDLTRLFADHVHPNDRGYDLMAGEFFRAITQPASGAGASFEGQERFFSTPSPLGPGVQDGEPGRSLRDRGLAPGRDEDAQPPSRPCGPQAERPCPS